MEQSRPIKNESVRWVKINGEIMLLEPKKGRYYKLNSSAALLWEHCDGTRDPGELARILARSFALDNLEQALKDVNGILRELTRNKVIFLR